MQDITPYSSKDGATNTMPAPDAVDISTLKTNKKKNKTSWKTKGIKGAFGKATNPKRHSTFNK